MEKIKSWNYLGSSQGYSGRTREHIFLVTSVDAISFMDGTEKGHESRCWGWYPTLKEAKKAVKMNAGDMAECCYYTHVVIEKMACGIPALSDDTKEFWYLWKVDPKDKNRFRGEWLVCKKPKWSEHIVGWGIG